MEPPTTHERKIWRRYHLELLGTFLLYALVLVVSIDVGQRMYHGIGQTLLFVSPMAPFLLMIAVIFRGIRSADEYQRLQILENIVIAAAVTAGWTFTYGFLENAGFPRLSMFTVWPVMGAVWAVTGIIRCLLSR